MKHCPVLKEVHIINIVWGEEYTQTFIQASLPSQLTSKNLPFLTTCNIQIRYRIFTTEKDQYTIEQSNVLQEIQRYFQVDFINIQSFLDGNKYRVITDVHALAIHDANKIDAGIVFLSPDFILVEGLFEELAQSIFNNKRVVLIGTPRVDKNAFLDDLQKQQLPLDQMYLATNLLPIALKNLHRISKEIIWNGKTLLDWPSHIYWKLSDTSLLIHAFHLHPIFIWPENKHVSLQSTIDGGYIHEAVPDETSWQIITKPHQLIVFEMSSSTIGQERQIIPCSTYTISYWAITETLRYQQRFILHKIILSDSKNLSPESAQYIEQSNQVVDKIFHQLTSPNLMTRIIWIFLLLRDPGKTIKQKLRHFYRYTVRR